LLSTAFQSGTTAFSILKANIYFSTMIDFIIKTFLNNRLYGIK
jgi:hypothetical protein